MSEFVDDDPLGDLDITSPDDSPITRWRPGGRGRPPKEIADQRERDIESAHAHVVRESLKTKNLHQVMGGVSVPWLMQVFNMGRGKVEQLLAKGGVRPVNTHRNGGVLYNLPDAAACLVTPKKDVEALIKSLKPSDLPINMQDGYWAAKLKEQKYRVQAGELWSTAAVMQVFGDTFKMMKTKIQLFPDTICESVGLSDEQRRVLQELLDDLLKEMMNELLRDETLNQTRSQLSELEDEAS